MAELMTAFYDDLERRSEEERDAALARDLPHLITLAKTKAAHYQTSLADIDAEKMPYPAKIMLRPKVSIMAHNVGKELLNEIIRQNLTIYVSTYHKHPSANLSELTLLPPIDHVFSYP